MTAAALDELPRDGLYPGVSLDRYTAWPAWRSSVLRWGARSPAHMRWADGRGEAESTAATELGHAAHCAVLEPDIFRDRFTLPLRRARRTRVDLAAQAVHEAEQAASGRIVITETQYRAALEIRERLRAQPWYSGLLGGPGIVELSVLWTDPETGLRCKARPDRVALRWLAPGWAKPGPCVVEIKTARDASPLAFRRQVERLGYHVQGRMQLEGLAALDPETWLDPTTLELRPAQLVWVVVESSPPHPCALYHPTRELLQIAGLRVRTALLQIAEAEATGRWPGYPEEPQPLEPSVTERRSVAPIEGAGDDAPL